MVTDVTCPGLSFLLDSIARISTHWILVWMLDVSGHLKECTVAGASPSQN